jgi:hypothetical protein
LCYAEVKIFQLMWDSLYAAPAAYDTFVLRGSWAQSQTMNVEYSKQAPSNVPLAVYRYGNAEGKGCPVLVQIPNGPHSVRFTLQRLDSGAMGVDGTHLAFMVQMNIVPADSRQTPLA